MRSVFYALRITLAIILVVSPFLVVDPVRASISSCSASVTPQVISTNTGVILQFSVTNNDASDNAVWVRMTAPSTHYQITGGSSSGWGRTINSAQVITFTGGAVPAGGQQTFNVQIQTGLSGVAPAPWGVQISSQSNGSGATSCSGNTNTQITDGEAAPTITNVRVENVTSTSVNVKWNTDTQATSLVRYGKTDAYGSTVVSGSFKESHDIRIGGLSPGTTYHYRVESTNAAGVTTISDNAVFTTAHSSNSLEIFNIRVRDITQTSAVVSWETSVDAKSQIEYGTTQDYGNMHGDGSFRTVHSFAVSDLTPDTTYHYRVSNADALGVTVTSLNNTFRTVAVQKDESPEDSNDELVTIVPSPSDTGYEESPYDKSPFTPDQEKEEPSSDQTEESISQPIYAPTVQVDTDLSRPHAVVPAIEGRAFGRGASIMHVSYSVDGGRTWLTINETKGLGTSDVQFAFSPSVEGDGNYPIRVRARDAHGNVGFSEEYVLVIDTRPPGVGPAQHSIGSMMLSRYGKSSAWTVLSGLDQLITFSAVGGPVTIDIIARSSSGEQTFSLVRDSETGLWSGAINLENPGQYELFVRAEDGAGNVTERQLNSAVAVQGGRVMMNNTPITDANVVVMAYDELSHSFKEWNGVPYDQRNPQMTDQAGIFRYFLPSGTYYVSILKDGLRPTQTEIFTIDHPTALRFEISMVRQRFIPLGPFAIPIPPLFWPRTVKMEDQVQYEEDTSSFESFLPSSMPEEISGPTVLTFLSDWSPLTGEQLDLLRPFAEKYPISPFIVHASKARTEVVQQRARYSVPFFPDTDGTISASFGIHSAPAHVVLDQYGNVKDVLFGIRTSDELVDAITPYLLDNVSENNSENTNGFGVNNV